MKTEVTKRLRSVINTLEHLLHNYPDATELLEEQIANLESVLEYIEIWWKE